MFVKLSKQQTVCLVDKGNWCVCFNIYMQYFARSLRTFLFLLMFNITKRILSIPQNLTASMKKSVTSGLGSELK